MSPPILPEHQDDPPPGEVGGRGRRGRGTKLDTVKSVLFSWAKETWVDVLTMAAFAAAALGIYQAPLASTRTFAVTFDASGSVVYPELAYPDRGWIISSPLSAFLSLGIPIFVILALQFRIKSFHDTSSSLIGLLYSLVLSTLFQVVIKILVGGFRPYFLSVCQPDISPEYLSSHNSSGLSGVGFQSLYFSSEICTTTDKAKLKTAMTSFPSGHSTAAWAGLFYLFLYLNAKLKVWADYRPAVWKIPFIFAPLLGAALISCSLTIDQAHNWYDVVAGAVIGTAFALACYRMVFASIWDWRFNHVPLQPKENFLYATGSEMRRDHALFTHRAGWGPRGAVSGIAGDKKTHGEVPRSSTTSGTTFSDGHEGRTSQDSAGLRLPPHTARLGEASGLQHSQHPPMGGILSG